MRFGIVTLMALGSLCGCAQVPNATISYYPSKVKVAVIVNQSIDCNATKSQVFTVNSVSATSSYSSDLSQVPHTFNTKALDGDFADANMTFNLTDDGRLKGINADSTGQGEAIVKSFISAATALDLLGGAAPPVKGEIAECTLIASWNGGKPVSLVYRAELSGVNLDTPSEMVIAPDPGSAGLYDQLQNQLPKFVLSVGSADTIKSGVSSDSGDGEVALTLNTVANVHLAVKSAAKPIWESDVIVPQKGTYTIPIPKPAFLGKQTFVLALSEAGAVNTITYGKLSGVAAAGNVVTAAANADNGPTAAERASEVKSEADLIAQNARLARCLAKPDTCT